MARVENTDLLSIGREYRLTVFIRRVEDTDELSTCEDRSIAVNGTELNSEKG